MAIIEDSENYFTNITHIVNFFVYTRHSGLLFCSIDTDSTIKEINRIIIERVKSKNFNIEELYLSLEDKEFFFEKISQAAKKKPAGLIITNLDELIRETEDAIIKNINFAREFIIDLNIPILFWLSENNISKFANQAPDIFLRRDRGVITFSPITGKTSFSRPDGYYSEEYKKSIDYNTLKMKSEILERQLKEAEQRRANKKNIANEIVLDLIDLYLDWDYIQEATYLFEKYKEYFDLKNDIKVIDIAANLFKKNYEFNKALEYFFLSKEIKEKSGDKSGLITSLDNIGFIYRSQGDYPSALAFFNESLKICKEIGKKDAETATTNNLAMVYQDLGKYETARDLLLSALDSSVKNFSDEHPNVAISRSNLAIVYKDVGEYEKARNLLIQALDSDLKNFGNDHPNVARCRFNLALVYEYLGEYEKAKDLLTLALDSDLKNFGNEHPNVARCRSILATVYQKLGKYETAKDLFISALDSTFKDFGHEHPVVAIRQNYFALFYLELKDYSNAYILFQNAYRIFFNKFGENHSRTLTVKKSLDYVEKIIKEQREKNIEPDIVNF